MSVRPGDFRTWIISSSHRFVAHVLEEAEGLAEQHRHYPDVDFVGESRPVERHRHADDDHLAVLL